MLLSPLLLLAHADAHGHRHETDPDFACARSETHQHLLLCCAAQAILPRASAIHSEAIAMPTMCDGLQQFDARELQRLAVSHHSLHLRHAEIVSDHDRGFDLDRRADRWQNSLDDSAADSSMT
jgi:hypothetical protein